MIIVLQAPSTQRTHMSRSYFDSCIFLNYQEMFFSSSSWPLVWLSESICLLSDFVLRDFSRHGWSFESVFQSSHVLVIILATCIYVFGKSWSYIWNLFSGAQITDREQLIFNGTWETVRRIKFSCFSFIASCKNLFNFNDLNCNFLLSTLEKFNPIWRLSR